MKDTVAVLIKSGQVRAAPSAPARDWVDMRFVDSALSELGKWPE